MATRIRFNPPTGEIETEGSETFVKEYFARLQKQLPDSRPKTGKDRKIQEIGPVDKPTKASRKVKVRPQKKALKAAKKVPGEKRGAHMETILGGIQGSDQGISTAGRTFHIRTGASAHGIDGCRMHPADA